jgi:hypothetical protein
VAKTPLQCRAKSRIWARGEFKLLKDRRNSIVHFQSSNETVHAANIIIRGLANTTYYDSLSGIDAENALSCAEELVGELLRLAGFDQPTVERASHCWIGPRASTIANPGNRENPSWIAPHVTR